MSKSNWCVEISQYRTMTHSWLYLSVRHCVDFEEAFALKARLTEYENEREDFGKGLSPADHSAAVDALDVPFWVRLRYRPHTTRLTYRILNE